VRQIRRVEQVLLYDPPAGLLTWIKHIFRFLAISTLLVAFVAFGAWIWREATGQTLWMMGKERSPLDYVVVFSESPACWLFRCPTRSGTFCSEAEAPARRGASAAG